MVEMASKLVEPVSTTDPGWAGVCKPFATTLDAVMSASDEALSLVLTMARSSPFEREAWTVVRLVRLADDPMAPIGSMARDALRSWEHLERLSVRLDWNRPDEVVSSPRATAIRNLALAVRQDRYRPLRFRGLDDRIEARLEAASRSERQNHQATFVHMANLRAAALPGLRECLDLWLRV